MTSLRKIGFLLFAVVLGVAGAEVGERLSVPGVHSFVSLSRRVGRPSRRSAWLARRAARCVAVRQGCIVVKYVILSTSAVFQELGVARCSQRRA